MKLTVLSIIKSKPSWVTEQFSTYSSRLNKSIQLNWKGLEPVKDGKASEKDQIRGNGKKLLASIPDNSFVIALDQKGDNWNTQKLKNNFEDWISINKEIIFLVGGQEGLSKDCLNRSNLIWSLSNLTLPHSFVPLIVAEQIFRAWSMTQNHPYHR